MKIRNPELRQEYQARRAKVIRLQGAIPLDSATSFAPIVISDQPENMSLADIELGVAAIIGEEAFDLVRWSHRKGLPMSVAEENFMNRVAIGRFFRPGKNRVFFEATYNKARTAWLEHFKNMP